MNRRIDTLIKQAKVLLSTRQGRNAVTFAVFLLIATIFWFMMTLNDEVQRDYTIPIKIIDLPDDVTLIEEAPALSVTVKDSGRNLIKYDWGKDPELYLKFSDFTLADGNTLTLTRQGIKSKLRAMFSGTTQFSYVNPDSLVVGFTSQPGVRMPVVADIDVQSSPRHIIFGQRRIIPDSITLYSSHGIPSNIVSVTTSPIAARGLSDTTTYQLKITVPNGMRAVPDVVSIEIPVEPLIQRTIDLDITTIGVPDGKSLVLFPPNVVITTLVPMSMYNDNSMLPKVVADYRDTNSSTNTVKLKLINIPDFMQSTSITPKSVEYVVDNR